MKLGNKLGVIWLALVLGAGCASLGKKPAPATFQGIPLQ